MLLHVLYVLLLIPLIMKSKSNKYIYINFIFRINVLILHKKCGNIYLKEFPRGAIFARPVRDLRLLGEVVC